MKEELYQSVQKFLDRFDDEELMQSDLNAQQSSVVKLDKILATVEDDISKSVYAKFIRQYMTASEVQKDKLLSYCEDFYDPTAKPEVKVATPTTIFAKGLPPITTMPHKYLDDDELYKLYQFVKNHNNDKSFGEAVYDVMAKHDLTPPQVYKRAYLSRQDFNRITSFSCKSVTKSMVWSVIIGLNCDLDEADYLLFSAGYRRRNNKFDLTLRYFVEHKNYDIMAINDVLARQDLKLLSCYVPVVD